MIDAGPCMKTADGMTVSFDLTPKPVRAMRELRFSVRLAEGGRPVERAMITVDLTMPGMQMGEHVVPLSALGDGRYAGTSVIIRCPSGKKLWNAGVSIHRKGTATTVDYRFEAP